jgi:hypothetical protein
VSRRSSNNLPVPAEASQAVGLPIDPVTGLGLLGAVAFAALIGGPLWAGLALMMAIVAVNQLIRQRRDQDAGQLHQDALAHHMLRQATPEDLADLMLAADVAQKGTYEFLEAIKHQFGGESVDVSTHRAIGENQLDPLSPGITLTVSHDLDMWWAKLQFSGATAKRYFPSGQAVWKARGKSPQAAVDAAIKRCAQARQQAMIQDYAARMVAEND